MGQVQVTRRGAVRLLTGASAFLLLGPPGRADPVPTVPLLARDRYFARKDPKTETLTIEGVAVKLDAARTPGDLHLTVRGDLVELVGEIRLPGRNVTILARRLVCGSGASISTAGGKGNPDYHLLRAPPGQDGARDTGNGHRGGDILIVAGEIVGSLRLDASGGAGGDAEDGGPGLDGGPGTPADEAKPGGPGQPGHAGGLAGKPGDGGDGGAIAIRSLVNARTIGVTQPSSVRSEAGAAGAWAHNGDPGGGGPGGPARSGMVWRDVRCGNMFQ